MSDSCQNMTVSDLCQCMLTFQRSSEVTDLDRPYTYITVTKLVVLGFLEVLKPNTWFTFNTETFFRPLYRFRCQSGPFAKSALGQFSRRG